MRAVSQELNARVARARTRRLAVIGISLLVLLAAAVALGVVLRGTGNAGKDPSNSDINADGVRIRPTGVAAEAFNLDLATLLVKMSAIA